MKLRSGNKVVDVDVPKHTTLARDPTMALLHKTQRHFAAQCHGDTSSNFGALQLFALARGHGFVIHAIRPVSGPRPGARISQGIPLHGILS